MTDDELQAALEAIDEGKRHPMAWELRSIGAACEVHGPAGWRMELTFGGRKMLAELQSKQLLERKETRLERWLRAWRRTG